MVPYKWLHFKSAWHQLKQTFKHAKKTPREREDCPLRLVSTFAAAVISFGRVFTNWEERKWEITPKKYFPAKLFIFVIKHQYRCTTWGLFSLLSRYFHNEVFLVNKTIELKQGPFTKNVTGKEESKVFLLGYRKRYRTESHLKAKFGFKRYTTCRITCSEVKN